MNNKDIWEIYQRRSEIFTVNSGLDEFHTLLLCVFLSDTEDVLPNELLSCNFFEISKITLKTKITLKLTRLSLRNKNLITAAITSAATPSTFTNSFYCY